MQLNPSEISELIKSKIQNLDTGAEVRTQGTVVSVTDGICRIHGLSDAMAGRDARVPEQHVRPRAEPRARLGRRGDPRRSTSTSPKATPSSARAASSTVPVGPELIGRVVNSLGQPIDGKGPVNAKVTDVIEKVAPGRDLAQVGVAAGADRPEVDRRDGADRPRPARADHRRPPDRQDRGGDRHDHQPEGQGPDLRLRRDRPEGVVDQERGAQARGDTARWSTRSSSPPRRRSRRRCSTSRRTPAARWASTSATAARTR